MLRFSKSSLLRVLKFRLLLFTRVKTCLLFSNGIRTSRVIFSLLCFKNIHNFARHSVASSKQQSEYGSQTCRQYVGHSVVTTYVNSLRIQTAVQLLQRQ